MPHKHEGTRPRVGSGPERRWVVMRDKDRSEEADGEESTREVVERWYPFRCVLPEVL